MNPILVITLFLLAIALIFTLMEIRARAAVRKFERAIKHSQGE